MKKAQRHESAAVQSAQQFLNLESISAGLIYTRDRYLIGFISVHGADRKLLDAGERESAMRQVSAVVEKEQQPFQILSIPRTVDVQNMVHRLEGIEEQTEQETMCTLLQGEITALQRLMDDGAKEPFLLLKIWERASTGADQRLIRRLNHIANGLNDCKVTARRLENAEVKWLCKLYANLDLFISKEENEEDIPVLQGQKRTVSTKLPENAAAQLLNEITPCGGYTFGSNRLQIGSTLARCYGITKYPSQVSYGWLVPLVSCLEAITCITYYPGNSVALGDALSKSIRRSSAGATQSNDARTKKQYIRRIEGADKMLDAIDARNLSIGHISIVVMPFTDDEGEFPKVCEKVVGLCGAAHLRLKSLGSLQKDAFRHLSPFYVNQSRIDHMLKQIIPLNTVTGGEPMTVTLLRDDNGIYFGQTTDGAPICVNLLYRGRDRTNGNLMALGTSGSGKSTAIKHLLESMYMMGVKILIIDPEREYRDLCRNLGGTWLDAGGGVAKANPLDIRAIPEDDDEEEEKLYASCPNAMSMHIKTLLVRLRLQIPSLTDVQLALLEDSLIQLYAQFGITFDTDAATLQPVDYPIMSDWYSLLRELEKENEQYRDLATLLQSMAVGADAYLWNGRTNIDMDAQLVCIDTNRLLSLSQQTQASIYFNLLSLCWDVASRDRDEPVVILADEAHMLFDPRLPEVGLYLRNIAKRIRKYEGGLWIATQSATDMLHESIRLAGQAIVDNSAYRLLFHCDAKNLEDTVELFRLTSAEAKLLSSFEQKNALCLIGAQHHIRTVFELPQYKLDLMGRGGGR